MSTLIFPLLIYNCMSQLSIALTKYPRGPIYRHLKWDLSHIIWGFTPWLLVDVDLCMSECVAKEFCLCMTVEKKTGKERGRREVGDKRKAAGWREIVRKGNRRELPWPQWPNFLPFTPTSWVCILKMPQVKNELPTCNSRAGYVQSPSTARTLLIFPFKAFVQIYLWHWFNVTFWIGYLVVNFNLKRMILLFSEISRMTWPVMQSPPSFIFLLGLLFIHQCLTVSFSVLKVYFNLILQLNKILIFQNIRPYEDFSPFE